MYKNLIKHSVTFGSSVVDDHRKYDSFKMSNFTINEFGTIRSDFAELMAAESREALLSAISRMKELYANDGDKGKSFDQIMSEVVPRSMQSPRELDLVEQAIINTQIDKYGKLSEEFEKRKSALEERRKQFEDFTKNYDSIMSVINPSKSE